MKNLKRIFSLALAGTMLAGMITIGASAADFTDAEEIQHNEAVNILVALNVINGQDDGSFNPEGDVTRAQMAKMIAVAMNGGKDTNTGVKNTPSFTDIKGHWAESYIEYCYDLGIINGRGNGIFDPEGNVTGLEATKMVLTALGYEAEAYHLTGAQWAVRTDELAKQADPNLYEELGNNVVMANKASRDTAAQIIWNGLQNQTRRVTPMQNTSTGEVTWQYGEGDIMLYERYNARIWTGTYAGNHDTDESVEDGSITVTDGILTYYNPSTKGEVSVRGDVEFPSELDISNIGEEVKIVFKDGKGGTTNKPDKKDTIYGVFNTGKTEVYNVTKADLQSTDAKKVKFGGTTYNMIDGGIEVVTNYITDVHPVSAAANAGLKAQSADTIKFVCDDDGKIKAAYVVEMNVAKVTAATSSKITLSAEGAIAIKDNDVAEGLAKDDVVVYTKFYSAKKDDAFYSVKKAETVEGQMTGFKFDGSPKSYQNVVVDGTTYKFHEPQTAGNLPAITDDAVADLFDLNNRSGASIGDQIRVYMVGGMAYAVESIEQTGGNYAIITEVGDNGTIGNNLNGLKVNVMLADGTEQIATVHKDSTNITGRGTPGETSAKITATATTHAAQAALLCDGQVGRLIEYTSISNGTIKIKDVIEEPGTAVNVSETLWNEDTKKLSLTGDPATPGNTAVAAANAVLFVGRDETTVKDDQNKLTLGDGKVDKWYVYDLRSLGTIKSEYIKGAAGDTIAASKAGVKVSYVTNNSGLVTAAYVTLNSRPGSTSADTLYGIVTGFAGSRQNTAGDDLFRYTVAVGRDEVVEVNVLNDSTLKAGMLVRFDETANGEYTLGADLIKLLDSNDVEHNVNGLDGGNLAGLQLAAVRDYREGANLLTYYTDTHYDVATKTFIGTEDSATVATDVKLYYVDGENNAQGAETGVMTYDTSTGYANALLHMNSKGIVDVIIVETSGNANMANTTTADAQTSLFGNATAALASGTTAANIKTMDDGVYTVADKPGDISSNASANQLVYFKFTAVQADITNNDGDTVKANQKYTLTIKNSDGTVVYEETSVDPVTAGGHIFYVDMSGTHVVGSPNSLNTLTEGEVCTAIIKGMTDEKTQTFKFVAGDYT